MSRHVQGHAAGSGELSSPSGGDTPVWSLVAGWLFTPLHLVVFATVLVVFHPVQVLARRLGPGAHERVVALMSGCVLASLRFAGGRVRFQGDVPLPVGRPLVVVSNHQSMYDIPLVAWRFRRHHPKFVAKSQLGRGLPSVSYNLRHGGSVLIDRANPRQALPALRAFGERIAARGQAACIFPEGTRSRDGALKPFNTAGLVTLLRAMPDAVVVPVHIEGAWRIVRHRFRPVPFGVTVACTVLEPVDLAGSSPREAAAEVEARIGRHSGRTPGAADRDH